MVLNIERAILATFLYANDLEDNLDEIYFLDTRAFSTPFNQRVAQKINEVKDSGYGFLSYQIEDSIEGTQYEQEFLYILEQTSLGLKFSKSYYQALLKKAVIKGALNDY